MVYIHENWSLFGPKVVEKLKLNSRKLIFKVKVLKVI